MSSKCLRKKKEQQIIKEFLLSKEILNLLGDASGQKFLLGNTSISTKVTTEAWLWSEKELLSECNLLVNI